MVWAGTALMVVVPYALGYDFWFGWLIWFGLVFFLGLGHPATVDTHTPLDGNKRIQAWATIALFILTFIPVPFSIVPPAPAQQQQLQPDPSQQPTPGISVMQKLPATPRDGGVPGSIGAGSLPPDFKLRRATIIDI